ncbi:hypothetical protein pdam_00022041, partial [Pocillopora damicornis]
MACLAKAAPATGRTRRERSLFTTGLNSTSFTFRKERCWYGLSLVAGRLGKRKNNTLKERQGAGLVSSDGKEDALDGSASMDTTLPWASLLLVLELNLQRMLLVTVPVWGEEDLAPAWASSDILLQIPRVSSFLSSVAISSVCGDIRGFDDDRLLSGGGVELSISSDMSSALPLLSKFRNTERRRCIDFLYSFCLRAISLGWYFILNLKSVVKQNFFITNIVILSIKELFKSHHGWARTCLRHPAAVMLVAVEHLGVTMCYGLEHHCK